MLLPGVSTGAAAVPTGPVAPLGSARRMRILFVVRTLNRGGAERQLSQLALGLRRAGHEIAVAVFYAGGPFEHDLRAGGIPVHDLTKRGRWDTVSFLFRLMRLVRRMRPDVLHAYMGANLFASALKPLFPRVKVVWGIRTARHDLRAYDWATRVGPWLHRMASPGADAIIANSEAARRQSAAAGLDGRQIAVIPNGIDCDAFRPDRTERARIRTAWGITDGTPLVGVIARLDPVKDHATFLRAAARVAAGHAEVRFVCVGGGTPRRRQELERLASELGVSARIRWAGERDVTRAVYGAIDLAVLSSSEGESFPNVVAEAMACGTPCVVTATGDAAVVVGDAGTVVPPRDPDALARAILGSLARSDAERASIAARARMRIEREYSLPKLVERTERVLAEIVPRR